MLLNSLIDMSSDAIAPRWGWDQRVAQCVECNAAAVAHLHKLTPRLELPREVVGRGFVSSLADYFCSLGEIAL